MALDVSITSQNHMPDGDNIGGRVGFTFINMNDAPMVSSQNELLSRPLRAQFQLMASAPD